MYINDDHLKELIECMNLKYIVRTYYLTMDQVKKYIVTHPMLYDNDDVDPYFITLCQPHLDSKLVYHAFK